MQGRYQAIVHHIVQINQLRIYNEKKVMDLPIYLAEVNLTVSKTSSIVLEL